MRKDFLAVALILLFVGMILVSATANIQEERTLENTEVARKVGNDLNATASSWSIAGDFTKGRKLRVVIQPGDNWIPEPAAGYDYLNFNVSIRDPQNGVTWLKVTYTKAAIDVDVHTLSIESAELLVDGGGLTFEESDRLESATGTNIYDQIWGIVRFSGRYSVTVYASIGVYGPPSILELFSLLNEVQRPYLLVTVLGAGLIVAGACLLIFGQKGVQHKKRTVKKDQKS
jgi:hypothetical protein